MDRPDLEAFEKNHPQTDAREVLDWIEYLEESIVSYYKKHGAVK